MLKVACASCAPLTSSRRSAAGATTSLPVGGGSVAAPAADAGTRKMPATAVTAAHAATAIMRRPAKGWAARTAATLLAPRIAPYLFRSFQKQITPADNPHHQNGNDQQQYDNQRPGYNPECMASNKWHITLTVIVYQ